MYVSRSSSSFRQIVFCLLFLTINFKSFFISFQFSLFAIFFFHFFSCVCLKMFEWFQIVYVDAVVGCLFLFRTFPMHMHILFICFRFGRQILFARFSCTENSSRLFCFGQCIYWLRNGTRLQYQSWPLSFICEKKNQTCSFWCINLSHERIENRIVWSDGLVSGHPNNIRVKIGKKYLTMNWSRWWSWIILLIIISSSVISSPIIVSVPGRKIREEKLSFPLSKVNMRDKKKW